MDTEHGAQPRGTWDTVQDESYDRTLGVPESYLDNVKEHEQWEECVAVGVKGELPIDFSGFETSGRTAEMVIHQHPTRYQRFG